MIPPGSSAGPPAAPSLLEFVQRAFREGGRSLELLSTMVESPLQMSLSNEEKFHLALAEVLRVKAQLQTLQNQMAQLAQDRERMNLLVWAELSRLGSKIDGTEGPISALIDEVSSKNDPILRAILGGASQALETPKDVSPMHDAPQRTPTKRLRTSLEDNSSHRPVSSEADSQQPGGEGSSPRPVSVVAAAVCSPATVGPSAAAPPTHKKGGDSVTEQQMLIDKWLEKQRAGRLRAGLAPDTWSSNQPWLCYVCGKEATDGIPGEHFCVGRFEDDSRGGLKVYCQYCRKGTARMPDLRVHFKKIVYCRLLREELKRQMQVLAAQQCTTATTSSSVDPAAAEGNESSGEEEEEDERKDGGHESPESSIATEDEEPAELAPNTEEATEAAQAA